MDTVFWSNDTRHLKELEEENRRLKNDVCGRAPESRDYPGSGGKKVVKPSQRRGMAKEVVQQGKAKIAVACRAFQINKTYYRYQAKLCSESEKRISHRGGLFTTDHQGSQGSQPDY